MAAIVIDVTHPGVRSTGASVLSLFQNLFGLALGPLVAGALSDVVGIEMALTITPLFSLVAAGAMLMAARTYATDMAQAHLAPDEAAGNAGPSPLAA